MIELFLVKGILIASLFQSTFAEEPIKMLKACPSSPNCVSTQTDQENKKMQPLSYSGDAIRVLEIIKKIVNEYPRTELVRESSDELQFTFTSALFGFVDDVDFLIDPVNQKIHFRSASRTGYGDLGVNRKRMVALSQKISAALK